MSSATVISTSSPLAMRSALGYSSVRTPGTCRQHGSPRGIVNICYQSPIWWGEDSEQAEEDGTEVVLTTHVINPSGAVSIGGELPGGAGIPGMEAP